MRTGVIKDIDLTCFPAAHEKDGATGNVPAHEVARIGDFRLMAQIGPARLKNPLLLECEDLRRRRRRAMVRKELLSGLSMTKSFICNMFAPFVESVNWHEVYAMAPAPVAFTLSAP